MESELIALLPEHLGEYGIPAVKDCDSAFTLFSDLGEHLVPVGPAGNGARL